MNTIIITTVVMTMIVGLPKTCVCLHTCSQYHKNNSTVDLGPPVFHGIGSSQTEIKLWYSTRLYRLSCCVTANPQPKIMWYKNGNILKLGTERLDSKEDGQIVLVSDIRMSDAGNYTCTAMNALGNISHTFLVKVASIFILQKPVVMIQPNSWKAVVGSNVTISCIIKKSARKPLVVWLHNVRNITKPCRGEKYHTLLKSEQNKTWLSNLTIFNVTKDDQGTYTCTAQNGAGRDEFAHSDGTLIVLDLESKSTLTHENDFWLTNNPLLISIIVVGSLIVITLVCVVCLLKRSKAHASKQFPVNELQSFQKNDTSFDNNPLLLHESEMHIEIPRENLQLRRCGVQANSDSDLDFDVFISYSSLDREFVKNCLYAELTTSHTVCIDFKDFEVGMYITDNIANSVFRSRKTLLVITRNFLKGVWTFFEMQLAQGRLSEGHDVLILVIVEDIPVDELPKHLQHYRKMKTYLEYFNEDVKPYFWDRLRSTVGPSLQEGKEP